MLRLPQFASLLQHQLPSLEKVLMVLSVLAPMLYGIRFHACSFSPFRDSVIPEC